jgi:hypothetical protein
MKLAVDEKQRIIKEYIDDPIWRIILNLFRREKEMQKKENFGDDGGLNFMLKDKLIYYTRENKVRLCLLKNFEKRVF